MSWDDWPFFGAVAEALRGFDVAAHLEGEGEAGPWVVTPLANGRTAWWRWPKREMDWRADIHDPMDGEGYGALSAPGSANLREPRQIAGLLARAITDYDDMPSAG